METIFEEINSKASKARTNMDYFHTAYMKATYSDLGDEAFKAVTDPINSQIGQIIDTAKYVAYRLQVLRDSNSDPNFLRDLNAVDEMAADVLAKSKTMLDIMRKAVADAKERKKAREETIKNEAAQERAREEEVRKKARNEPGESSSQYKRN